MATFFPMLLQWTKPTDFSTMPYFLAFRSSKRFIMAVVFCMAFTDIFLYGLVVPVIPRALEQRVGIPADKAQSWTSILLAVYGGALLVSAPCCGYLADRSKSRRFPLISGLFILAGATVMLCVGRSIMLFIAGRLLQGMSAAMVWTVGLALLADTVDEEELGKCLGFITLAMSGGTLVGPLLGGVVYDKAGYYAVFAMAFALISLDVALRVILIEKKIARMYVNRIDGLTPGTLTALHEMNTEAIETVIDSSSMVGNEPSHQLSSGQDQRSGWKRKLPPVLWLLSSRRLLVALFASLVFGVILTSFDAVLPLFVSQTFAWSSTGSGLIFFPIFLPSIFSPLVGHLTDLHGPRLPASTGFLLALPPCVLLRLITHKSLRQETLLCALLTLIGLATTLISTPIFTEIIHIVYEKERQHPGVFGKSGATAQAYGLFNVAFAAGTIAGPLLAGFLRDRFGWGTMGWCLGLICGVASVPVFLVTGGWVGKRRGRMRN